MPPAPPSKLRWSQSYFRSLSVVSALVGARSPAADGSVLPMVALHHPYFRWALRLPPAASLPRSLQQDCNHLRSTKVHPNPDHHPRGGLPAPRVPSPWCCALPAAVRSGVCVHGGARPPGCAPLYCTHTPAALVCNCACHPLLLRVDWLLRELWVASTPDAHSPM